MSNGQEALSPFRRLEGAIQRVVKSLIPTIGVFDSPRFGRVLAVNTKGGKVDQSNKRFSVDVQILKKDFSIDNNFGSIKDVPIDSGNFGNGGVVYCTPKKNAIVRVAFMYNDPSFPYIQNITNEGFNIPEGSEAEYRIETKDGVILQLKDGKITIKTETFNVDFETWINNFLIHSHLVTGIGSPTGPSASGTPPVQSIDFKGGGL